MISRFIGICCILTSAYANAWNASGHVLISRLAYQYMTPKAKNFLHQYVGTTINHKVNLNLDESSIWLDNVRKGQFKKTAKLHYIDLPFGDEKYFPKLDTCNVLFAITHAQEVLRQDKASSSEKVIAFRILLHTVADLHQPMHAVSYYSNRFPHGDKGGNAIKIRKYLYHGSLHHFWDEAGGWLRGFSWRDDDLMNQKLAELSRYDCNIQNIQQAPSYWAKQSFEIAKNKAYFPPKSYQKFAAYQNEAQTISKQQMQIAACYLARMMNQLS
jgi:hypothetical protein